MSSIPISGKGKTGSELPVSLAGARDYFQDLPAFLAKIEAVDQIKPLARPGAFLVTHHPVGGLDYKVVMICVLQAEWHATGMRLTALDFDADKHKCDYPVVKGFIEGELLLKERAAASTQVDFTFTCSLDLPLAGVLKFLPRVLVQTTADGIIGYQVNQTVQSLFRKVLEDFRLGAPAPRLVEEVG